MNAKIFLLFFVMAVMSLSVAYSQGDFRSGYVVLNNGDTLHGLIDYSIPRSRAVRCIFKEHAKAPKQIFNPEDAREYRFTDGNYFISRVVTLEDETVYLFLEYLFNGIVDVYLFGGLIHQPSHNFLIESGDSPYELKIVREVIQVETNLSPSRRTYRTYSKINQEYKDVLKELFIDGPEVANKVDTVFPVVSIVWYLWNFITDEERIVSSQILHSTLSLEPYHHLPVGATWLPFSGKLAHTVHLWTCSYICGTFTVLHLKNGIY